MQHIDNLYYCKLHLDKGLKHIVKYAWVMKSYELKSKKDLLIPDGYPEIIFVQKGAYLKELLGQDRSSAIIDRSCVIGIQTQTVLASRIDYCALVGLKLRPAGAYCLFGNRLKETFEANISIDDFGIKWLTDLNEAIKHTEQKSALAKLLNERLTYQTNHQKNSRSVEEATSYIDSILSVKGQISVQELANNHYTSVRHFQRKFKGFFGLSPKKFLNIIRFKHLYKSSVLQKKIPANHTNYGYYDQTHFIKDFRKHLGITPSESSDPSFVQRNKIAQISS